MQGAHAVHNPLPADNFKKYEKNTANNNNIL